MHTLPSLKKCMQIIRMIKFCWKGLKKLYYYHLISVTLPKGLTPEPVLWTAAVSHECVY